MLLTLTDLSEEPLQGQISRQIRAKILAGELGPEAALPSIRRLAREQHISVITVQRAYEFLEREGLIHSRRGKGFFVIGLSEARKKKMAAEKLRDNLAPAVREAADEGLTPQNIRDTVGELLEKMIKERKR